MANMSHLGVHCSCFFFFLFFLILLHHQDQEVLPCLISVSQTSFLSVKMLRIFIFFQGQHCGNVPHVFSRGQCASGVCDPGRGED